MPKFKDLRRKALLPDLITSEIMDILERGDLVPGDILPTEAQLAEEFGVSRNVVREAIARLKSDGVVDTKQGRGATIKPLSERETFRIEATSLSQQENLRSFFELREILEVQAAYLAAQNRDEDDLTKLTAAMQALEGVSAFDDDQFEADAKFHRALGRATGNGYLATLISYLSSRTKLAALQSKKFHDIHHVAEATLDEHRAIYGAILMQDGQAAQTAMQDHLRAANRRLGLVEQPTVED